MTSNGEYLEIRGNPNLPNCRAWELYDRAVGSQAVCIGENLADECPDDLEHCRS